MVIVGSQKTLPIAITVIGFIGSVGEEGLMAIPCIVAHTCQIFIDGYLSMRWANEPKVSLPGVVSVGSTGSEYARV